MFALQFSSRVAADAVLASLFDDERPESERNGLAITAGLLGSATGALYVFLVLMWLATGRGPGGRLFAAEIGGPRQHPKRRPRSSPPG
jgi:hypothetical protein